MDYRAKEVINGLKVENKRLKHENKELRKVADRFANILSPHASIEEIREDVRLLKQDNVVKMEKMRIAYVTIILPWCMFVFLILFMY